MTPSDDDIRSWIAGLEGPDSVAYEAGPTGFGLYRALTAAGVRCVVVAPSKLQRPSGDRVKKTRRTPCIWLGYCASVITAVSVPSVAQEAARDLVRAREDCRSDLMRARHRLSKLLLRQGIVYSDGSAWTNRHDAWLCRQRFDDPVTTMAFECDHETVLTVTARQDRLDTATTKLAADSEFTAVVQRLCCLRGISTLTGFALAAEVGDWQRFSGNNIGSFVGLVPSEHSSGLSRVQGSITKAGKTPARRLLVEAAWHHRAHFRPGKIMRERWELASPAARQRGEAGNRDCTSVGFSSTSARSDPPSPTLPSPASWPAGAGPWPSSNSGPIDSFVAADGDSSAWSDPRISL